MSDSFEGYVSASDVYYEGYAKGKLTDNPRDGVACLAAQSSPPKHGVVSGRLLMKQ